MCIQHSLQSDALEKLGSKIRKCMHKTNTHHTSYEALTRISPQTCSTKPAFPCTDLRIEASSSSPMLFCLRSHSIKAPLAASAGARAAAPSAPRLFRLRLCNKRGNATGHQQGKRRLRIKFGFWASLLHFRQRACGSYHSRNSVCSDWTYTVVPEVER